MSWRIEYIEKLDKLKKFLEHSYTNPVDFKLKVKDFYYDLPPPPSKSVSIEEQYHIRNLSFLRERIEKLEAKADLSWYRDSIEKLIERIKNIEHIHHEKNFVSYDRLLERMEKLEDERYDNIATVHNILTRIEELEAKK